VGDATIGIVGAGIVGLAIGRELSRRHPDRQIVVFDKEPTIAAHQTGHNSGVVHAGIYYRPGSLKAELCTRGRGLLREFCAERGIAFDQCGKLVVAVDPDELGRLDALEGTATQNGVPGLRRVDAKGIREIEPFASGIAALHSPETAITDYVAIAKAYAEDIVAAGGDVLLGTRVVAIERRDKRIVVRTSKGVHTVDQLVICAGLHADIVSQPVDGQESPRIVPFRGEYMSVVPHKRDLVRGMIYPVPDPRYPFLGVHFTRRVSGELEVGPNAVLALKREGYRWRDVSVSDMRLTLGWPGFWRMARKHWRTGASEVWGSVSTSAYMRRASRYVPEISHADVTRGGSGVRAQAVDRDGSLVDDFRVFRKDGIVTVRNAPSPGATSSLAIAEYVVDVISGIR
jgi:(S)-2-hydroxyglutarate dehydrogenase